jgi:hypothetical protein
LQARSTHGAARLVLGRANMASAPSTSTFEVFLLVTVWAAISIGVIMLMVVLLM